MRLYKFPGLDRDDRESDDQEYSVLLRFAGKYDLFSQNDGSSHKQIAKKAAKQEDVQATVERKTEQDRKTIALEERATQTSMSRPNNSFISKDIKEALKLMKT